MTMTSPYATVEALECFLGDPMDPSAPISYKDIIRNDEDERFPDAHMDVLYQFGYHLHVVPEKFGGKLRSYQELALLFRSVARRDLSLAVSSVLLSVGYTPFLVAGTEEQKTSVARLILHGGKVSWGISEGQAGSDIMANQLMGRRTDDGYRVTGRKWPIGNATRGDGIVVMARTQDHASPGAFSLLYIDKRDKPRQHYTLIPKDPLHGLRGMDLSGIAFHDCPVSASDRIGRDGEGLEITLLASQVMRTGIGALSLGAADTGLRLAMGFCAQRVLFGQRLLENRLTRMQLCQAFSDILIADILLMSGVRALHVCPKQLGLLSSIIKYQIPVMLDDTLRMLSNVIGARYYLRDKFGYGMFQKMLRDACAAGFIEGNTVVNLKVIAFQMGVKPSLWATRETILDETTQKLIADLFSPLAPLPGAGFSGLRLIGRGDNPVLAAFSGSIAQLEEIGATNRTVVDIAVRKARALHQRLMLLADRLSQENPISRKAFNESTEAVALSRQYALLHAAASCVHFAVHARDQQPETFRDLNWLVACLHRIEQQFDPFCPPLDESVNDAVFESLHALYLDNKAFSAMPYQLAGRQRALSEWNQYHGDT